MKTAGFVPVISPIVPERWGGVAGSEYLLLIKIECKSLYTIAQLNIMFAYIIIMILTRSQIKFYI